MRQNWCNGRIGTFGLSYAAHTQAALGCLDPPGLAAQFLDCGGFSNAYHSGIRHGGASDLKQATWAYNNALADAKDPAVKAALEARDIRDWFARMPWRKGNSPISAAPEYEDYLLEQWSHGYSTIGGAISSEEPVMRAGAYDQREGPGTFGAPESYRSLAERPDILVFSTPPLPREMEVTGPVRVRLWVASDAPDTDFTVKLIDVHPPNDDYPDGFAMNLTEGILRARYRDSWERPSLLRPGQVYAVTIELFLTSNLFLRGHRLRLDIASSNFPHFDVNPNSGEPEGASAHRPQSRLRRCRSPVAHRAAGHCGQRLQQVVSWRPAADWVMGCAAVFCFRRP